MSDKLRPGDGIPSCAECGTVDGHRGECSRAEERWWRIERERAEPLVIGCREDLAAAHAEAKLEASQVFKGVGRIRIGDPPGRFSIDWDTVTGVFEVPEPAYSLTVRGPVQE